MSGMELFQMRDDLIRRLSETIRQMERYGVEKAKAENDYKIELAQTALKLKDSGMTATMVQLVIHGTDNVPKLRMKRDIAQTMYDVAAEDIQSTKLQLRLIEAQIDREWGEAKRTV